MPKLTKKHRTFDCDLNDLEYQRKSRLELLFNPHQNPAQNSNQPPAPLDDLDGAGDPLLMVMNENNDNNNNLDDDGNDQFTSNYLQQKLNQTTTDNCQQQLSKLTLSSSLHQFSDSKYLNNQLNNAQTANNNFNNNNNNNQTTTTTTIKTLTNNHNNYEQNKSIATTNNQKEANLDTVHVVVGNEACDLDSTVSCLLMFHIISKMSDEINGKDKGRTLYVPLLNTTREMLDSKHEVLWFLEKTLNIDKSFLTCKDDIDWNEIKKNGIEVLITLVDHNYNDEFKDIGRIVEIIDHHQITNPKWLIERHSQIRLTIDTSVGSCTTLIAERLFYIYAEHHITDEILLLIYGTVLLDTICLSEKAKRFTRRDVYLLNKLDSLLGSKKPVRDELYKQLVEIKNSTRELNFEKLMKRDLKVFKDKNGMRIGIASLFGMEAKEALGLAANIDLDLFFQQNHYEAFIIMGLIANLDHSDSISRDLVLISANQKLFEELCNAFEQDTSKLDLVPMSGCCESSPDPEDNIINNNTFSKMKLEQPNSTTTGTGNGQPAGLVDSTSSGSGSSKALYKVRIWLQRNVSSSRKVVAPLVLKVLHDGAV